MNCIFIFFISFILYKGVCTYAFNKKNNHTVLKKIEEKKRERKMEEELLLISKLKKLQKESFEKIYGYTSWPTSSNSDVFFERFKDLVQEEQHRREELELEEGKEEGEIEQQQHDDLFASDPPLSPLLERKSSVSRSREPRGGAAAASAHMILRVTESMIDRIAHTLLSRPRDVNMKQDLIQLHWKKEYSSFRIRQPPLGEGTYGIVSEATREDYPQGKIALKVFREEHGSKKIDVTQFGEVAWYKYLSTKDDITKGYFPSLIDYGYQSFSPPIGSMGTPSSYTQGRTSHNLWKATTLHGINMYSAIHSSRQTEARAGIRANIRDVMWQLLCGLASMHRDRVLHLDLKPANLIWDGQRVRLIDFGSASRWASALGFIPALANSRDDPISKNDAVFMDFNLPADPLITYMYRPPESIQDMVKAKDNKFPTGNCYDARADVWSVGAIMYEILTGRYFIKQEDGDSLMDILVKIWETFYNSTPTEDQIKREWPSCIDPPLVVRKLRGKFDDPTYNPPGNSNYYTYTDNLERIKDRYGQDARDILEKMLTLNPKERWTVFDLLQHPFFQERHLSSPHEYQAVKYIPANQWVRERMERVTPSRHNLFAHDRSRILKKSFSIVDPSGRRYGWSVKANSIYFFDQFLANVQKLSDPRFEIKVPDEQLCLLHRAAFAAACKWREDHLPKPLMDEQREFGMDYHERALAVMHVMGIEKLWGLSFYAYCTARMEDERLKTFMGSHNEKMKKTYEFIHRNIIMFMPTFSSLPYRHVFDIMILVLCVVFNRDPPLEGSVTLLSLEKDNLYTTLLMLTGLAMLNNEDIDQIGSKAVYWDLFERLAKKAYEYEKSKGKNLDFSITSDRHRIAVIASTIVQNLSSKFMGRGYKLKSLEKLPSKDEFIPSLG